MAPVAVNRDHLRGGLDVFGNPTSVNGNALQSHEALSNLGIRSGIDLASFSIAKKLIQGIKVAFSGVVCGMLTKVSSVSDRIIDWTIGTRLLGRVVAVVGIMMGRTVVGSGAGMHLSTVVIVTSGISFSTPVSRALPTMSMLFWGAKEDRVISMSLDVLLQVLRALESLSAEIAFMRLQRNMYSNVGCDMVAFDCGGPALVPAAGKIQIVCALAANMLLADVFK
jgi:hypothetical protein